MSELASPAGSARCDLHVHSRFSTDSGNYALKRGCLGEGAQRVATARTWERPFAELRDAYRIAVHGTPSELATRLAA